MNSKIKHFIKKEVVLCVAFVLAVLSSFFVTPDAKYVEYIDFHTLMILFCLMCIMGGLQEMGVFQKIAGWLLGKVRGIKQITLLLVLMCFFFSMAITNDVALITFVPFTFIVGKMLGDEVYRKMVFPTVVLQTIGANLGSMLTPIGNPQNLYLYGISGMDGLQFIRIMLPYSLCSLVLLVVCSLILGKKLERASQADTAEKNVYIEKRNEIKVFSLVIYLVAFVFCLLTVAGFVPLRISAVVVVAGVVLTDYRVFGKVDYCLLLTFIAFFVFIGNMGRIPAFSRFLQTMVAGNEVWISVLVSQCISNVPAALLLSGFTDNIRGLLIGTNLGGLGTLIASMASLISYKYVAVESEKSAVSGGKGRYFLYFTVANIGFLVVLMLGYTMIH